MDSLRDIQRELLRRAAAAQKHAYCPYSDFPVGAAVLCELMGPASGIHSGCNVENASSGLAICAERNAVAVAIAAGAEPGTLTYIAVIGGEPDGPAITPCGACRQVLAEFSRPASERGGMQVLCAPRWSDHAPGCPEEAAEISAVRLYTLAELLPHAFSL